MKKLIVSMAMAAVASGAAAEPRTFIVSAAKWGAAQNAAVAAAGGQVSFQHDGAGLAVVTSENADFAASLKASGAVQSVDEDMMVQWQAPMHTVDIDESAVNPSNDTFYTNIQWAPQAVDAPGAWAAGYTGAGVRVAIIDGGIHSAHLDLAPNLDVAASRSFVPGFNFNQDTGTFWHGTHVAGIVAAADNTIGTVGIAPGARIIGVKALHSGSGQFGWIIGAILYAATPLAEGGAGAQIINMSLGADFERGGGPTGAGPLVAALNKAVNYADRHGVLVVSAAGNDSYDLDHTASLITVPAQSGSGIAVSSTGPEGFALGANNFRRPASYTNYGVSAINVAGPGGDFALPGNALCTRATTTGTVTIPCWAFDMVLSTSRGGATSVASYSWAAGTSMAAPAVSAVAALALEANPGMSLGALKNKLAQSADDEGKKGADPFYGKGFVNARKAVQ
jgi:lantibiotic leader peptide-processing serine protease